MKRKNSLNSNLIGLAGTGMILSSGSMMAGIPALNAPAGIKESFVTGASFMPAMTAITMTGGMLNQIKGLNQVTRRKKR